MLMKMRIREAVSNYIADAVLILLALGFYRTNEYYTGFLNSEAQLALLYIAAAYLIFALPFYMFFPFKKSHVSKGMILFSALRKAACHNAISREEKVVLLFIAVKFFYIPLMLNFVFSNFHSLQSSAGSFVIQPSLADTISYYLYPLALSALFFIDTVFFMFGYLAEADFLKNSVRSVEMTFLGWAAALLTYPPFNSIFNRFFPWVANDYANFGEFTAFMRIIIIALIVIFVWATLSLGTKCSNLTNRGIVSRGPYKYVRHPAYVSKNAAWWLTIIPVLSIGSIIVMAAWSFLYYLRAVTEERHLSMDPEYVEYRKNVRYRFIPGVV